MSNDFNNKKYYWLKLGRNFFKNARIKKLRKIAGGDTFVIIYLKMMLLSIEYDGIILYEGIEKSIEEELALKLDEDLDNLKLTVSYLKNHQLLEERERDYILEEAKRSIGSETQSNVYKRVKKLENFQSNSNTVPIEIDIDIEKDIDIYIKNKTYCPFENEILTFWNDLNIIKHKLITDKTKKRMNEFIKSGFNLKEIMLCMNRYNQMLKDETYFFKYKWNLEEFICRQKGILEFKEDGVKWLNYIESKSGKKAVEVFDNNNSLEEMKKGGWL